MDLNISNDYQGKISERIINRLYLGDKFKPWEIVIILKQFSRYETEPYRTKVRLNYNATTLSELFDFRLTIEGSAYWTEINNLFYNVKKIEQTSLDI